MTTIKLALPALILLSSYGSVSSRLHNEPRDSFNNIAKEFANNFMKFGGDFREDSAIKAVTEEELRADKAILGWVPPFDFNSKFPYYLSGHDYDSRPIWVVEMGKWDVRPVWKAGEAQIEAFDKYIRQLACRYLHSIDESGVDDFVIIMDYANITIEQSSSDETRILMHNNGRKYTDVIERHLASVLVVNANYMAEIFIMMFRTSFGQIQDRIEVFGNNRDKWVAEIAERLPKDQIPEAYGGRKGFRPLEVYG